MKPALHQLSLPGAMLARGFWLYVWKVTTASGKKWLYVGRTGDSSSPNAQSPFSRLSQHLSQNPKSNALRRNLLRAGVNADTCQSFELSCYGPIFAEAASMDEHRPSRDVMAGLEKGLGDALNSAGYRVLNDIKSRHPIDELKMVEVLNTFAARFSRLRNHGSKAPEPAEQVKA